MRVIFVILAAAPAFAQSALDIVQRSVDRDLGNFERHKDYTYREREQERDFDAQGAVIKTESETSEVLILAGRPYDKLIAKNDQPLSGKDTRREQEKMDRELARRLNAPQAEKARREKERAENRKLLEQLPAAFNFRLDGEDLVSGKPAWVIEAEPRPDFKPANLQARVLSKVRGKVWIDKADYQWVKWHAEVLDTISVGLALLRIAPGGSIDFEQKRINDEIWLPAHLRIRADARLVYLKKIRTEIDIAYSDYRKFQADSKVISTEDK